VTANTIVWNSVRDEILSDPQVKTEYDALSPEFELAQIVITLFKSLESSNGKKALAWVEYVHKLTKS
jgi:hypothetical protein